MSRNSLSEWLLTVSFAIDSLHVTSHPRARCRCHHACEPLDACLTRALQESVKQSFSLYRDRLTLAFWLEMPAFPSAQPFHEGYFSQLIGPARVRYKEKIQLCENVDPYTLRLGMDTSTDASLLPSVAHGDIVSYLVFSTSFVTLDQMKAYKSLESHNYFTSGWVKSLSAKKLGEDKVVLLGEVSAQPFLHFQGPSTGCMSFESIRRGVSLVRTLGCCARGRGVIRGRVSMETKRRKALVSCPMSVHIEEPVVV